MSQISAENPWTQFNLGNNNLDPGGGILYAIRYDTPDLQAQQVRVAEALDSSGAAIQLEAGIPGVDIVGLDAAARQKAFMLLEELSVVNEALEYHAAGYNQNSVSELADTLKSAVSIKELTNENKGEVLDMLEIGIPQIVHDLRFAHLQNGVLSEHEVATVDNLSTFAAHRAQTLGSQRVFLLGR